MGELFTEPASLDIKATGEGSFDVHLILHGVGMGWDQVAGVLTGEGATAVMVLRDLIVGSSPASGRSPTPGPRI